MIRYNIISFLSLILILFITGNTKTFMNPDNFSPDLPQADLDFMNSPEFTQMMEEFERELASLSPEERAAFDEMMNEFARVIEEMPEEEFNKLLEDINNDMQMSEDMGLFSPNESVDVSVAPAAVATAPVVKLDIPDEIKDLAELLQSTKTNLALFLSKIQIAPDLTLKIDKWINNKKIANIPTGYSWLELSENLEKLLSLLSIMLETDAKSNPIFLFEIHNDPNVEHMLTELSDSLAEVPFIDIAEFGIKQEREANEQVQYIISELSDLLLQKGLIQKLDSISQKKPEVSGQKKELPSPGKPEVEEKRADYGRFDQFSDFEDFDFE